MTVKKISLLFLFIFICFTVFFVFQDRSSSLRDSSALTNENKVLENRDRDLVLGQPKFILNEKSHISILKKHIEKQWALKDISFLEAWKVLDEEKTKKKPIVIAVIDTGIHKEHPCLKNRLWINSKEIPDNGKDDDNNGFVDDVHGWNFVGNNNDIQDYHGHGTHVSGIIAAQGATPTSQDCQVTGVAPYALIMTLKYFDSRTGSNNNVENTIKSIEYAVQNGADIINYSGGGPGANSNEKAVIARAADKNIIFVAALGNEGLQIGKSDKYYPASYRLPNILSVHSQNEQKEIARSSNRIHNTYLNNKLDQTAPGENIISTLPPQIYLQSHLKSRIVRRLASFSITHNHYGKMTGTSQATAVTTGVTALVKTLYPSWTMEKQINQVEKTGFGQETEKIKKVTNEGKKLNAYEALIMRDQNIDLSDKIDNTNTVIPHDPEKVDSVLKNPKKQTEDTYYPGRNENNSGNQFQILENIKNTLPK